MESYSKNAILLLKLGVSFAFIYPAVSAFIDPSAWIGYVPMWVDQLIPREIFLPIFSTIEIVVALGVLFWNNPIPSIIAGAMLVSIVIFNKSEFSVVFRDLSIATMTFGLALLSRKK
ncbi:MAG TPA: hypothetical protein DCS23_02695 [Candidatus Yonathbacteria bacterium]|nr:hypothetical protein [Candidatus Yonathbacteria bacterium]